jgi:hypothetical protein
VKENSAVEASRTSGAADAEIGNEVTPRRHATTPAAKADLERASLLIVGSFILQLEITSQSPYSCLDGNH